MIYVVAFIFLFLSFLFGMIGLGGGVLYMPVQLFAGIDFNIAAAMSLFLIVVTSFSASAVYIKEKLVDWKLVAVLELFTSLGGFIGGFYSVFIPEKFLMAFLSIILAISGLMMIFQKKYSAKIRTERKSAFDLKCGTKEKPFYINLAIGIPISIVAGLVSGMVGIGGGVFKLPLMILILGVPLETTFASSALMVGITAIGGLSGRLANLSINWFHALILASTVLIGARFGAKVSIKTDKKLLKKILGAVLIFTSIILFLKKA